MPKVAPSSVYVLYLYNTTIFANKQHFYLMSVASSQSCLYIFTLKYLSSWQVAHVNVLVQNVQVRYGISTAFHQYQKKSTDENFELGLLLHIRQS